MVFANIMLWGRSSSQISHLIMLLERELVWHTTVCDQGVENSHAKQYQELLHQWYFLTKPLENDPFIRVFQKF